jgi:prepilin-type N-terminal cleavage/methylation domain-containing protein
MARRRAHPGFTIVELLVVIAIIALLSSIVLASLSAARRRARDARRISDLKQLQLSLQLYYDTNRAYPDSLAALAPAFIPTIPKDPISGADYMYTALLGVSPTACLSYHVGTKLEVYTQGSGSPFNDDFDGTPGGTYGTGLSDGQPCGGGADFDGTDSPSNPVYDMRP